MRQEAKKTMNPHLGATAAKAGERGASEEALAMAATRGSAAAPVKKMAKGGMCRGMGAAKRGGSYRG